jgi:N6-adenosine-specific RNA methylase IME4
VELFARRTRNNWISWGDEVESQPQIKYKEPVVPNSYQLKWINEKKQI